jgi:hypothetical protein
MPGYNYKEGYGPPPPIIVALVVSVLATGPKGCWFELGQGDVYFKGDKNPQHTFLSGVK